MDELNVNKDLIRGHVDTFILRSLWENDKYGYEILSEIETKSKGLYVLKQPTLYSCLKRLEKQNLISSYLGDVSQGAQRRYYKLTEEGRSFVMLDQKEWEYSRTIIDKLLSNREFNPEADTHPFDASSYRPLTKRVKKDEIYEFADESSTLAKQDHLVSSPLAIDKTLAMQQQGDKTINPSVASNVHIANADILLTRETTSPSPFDAQSINESSVLAERDVYSALAKENDYIITNVNENHTKFVPAQSPAPVEYFVSTQNSPIFHTESKTIVSEESVEELKTVEFKIKSSEAQDPRLSAILQDFVQQSTTNIPKVTQAATTSHLAGGNSSEERRPKKTIAQIFGGSKNDGASEVNYINTFNKIYSNSKIPPTINLSEAAQQRGNAIDHYDNTATNLNDLKIKLFNDGFKLKAYNKSSSMDYYANNFYHCNKLGRDCMFFAYILFVIQVVLTHFILQVKLNLQLSNMFIVLGVFAIIPMLFFIRFLHNPLGRARTLFNIKTALLTSGIICINLVLVICLVGFFIIGVDISNNNQMLIPIILPICFLVNIPIAVVIYSFMYKSGRYALK